MADTTWTPDAVDGIPVGSAIPLSKPADPVPFGTVPQQKFNTINTPQDLLNDLAEKGQEVQPLVDTSNDSIVNKIGWALPNLAYKGATGAMALGSVGADVLDTGVAATGLNKLIGTDPFHQIGEIANSLDPNIAGALEGAGAVGEANAATDAAVKPALQGNAADIATQYVNELKTRINSGQYTADEIRDWVKTQGVDPTKVTGLDEAVANAKIGQQTDVAAIHPDAEAPVIAAADKHNDAVAAYDAQYAQGKGLRPGSDEYNQWLKDTAPLAKASHEAYQNLLDEHNKYETNLQPAGTPPVFQDNGVVPPARDAIPSGDEGKPVAEPLPPIDPAHPDAALAQANDAHDVAVKKYADLKAAGAPPEELAAAQKDASAAYQNLIDTHTSTQVATAPDNLAVPPEPKPAAVDLHQAADDAYNNYSAAVKRKINNPDDPDADAAAKQAFSDYGQALLNRDKALADGTLKPKPVKVAPDADNDGLTQNQRIAASMKEDHAQAISEAPQFEKDIEGKDFDGVVEHLANNASRPAYRVIAKAIQAKVKNLRDVGHDFALTVVHPGDEVKHEARLANGSMGLSDNAIFHDSSMSHIFLRSSRYDKTPGTTEETALHEIVHAVTQHDLTLGRLSRGTVAGKAATDLDNLFKHVVTQLKAKVKLGEASDTEMQIHYGLGNHLQNPDELIAWGMTNKKFQDYLDTVKVGGQTAFSAFVSKVRDLLGLPKATDSALSRLIKIHEDLMDSDSNELTPHQRSIIAPRLDSTRAQEGGNPDNLPAPSNDGSRRELANAGRDLALNEEDASSQTNRRPGSDGTRDNLNYERFTTDDEVDNFIKSLKSNGMYGTQTNPETISKMKDLLKNNSMEHIILHDPKVSEAAEYGLAKRTVVAVAGSRLRDAFLDFQKAGGEDSAPQGMWDRVESLRLITGAAKESASNIAGLGGRLLQQFNIMAGKHGADFANAKLDELLRRNGAVDRGTFSRAMLEHLNNPSNIPDIAAGSFKPYWEDYAMKLWYNAALSSPKTWVMTAVDNAQQMVLDLAAHTLAPSVSRQETAARWGALLNPIRDTALLLAKNDGGFRDPATMGKAAQDVRQAFKEGHPVTGNSDAHVPIAVPLGPFEWTSVGPKMISAVDQTFRGISAQMEIHGLSIRRALSEGLKPGNPEYAQRVADLRLNPSKDMVKKANEKAMANQYADKLGGFGEWIQSGSRRQINMAPAARIRRAVLTGVFPFMRVESNILKNILKDNLISGPAFKEVRTALTKGSAQERDVALAKMTIGSSLIAAVVAGTYAGKFTGAPDSNYRMAHDKPDAYQPNAYVMSDGSTVTLGNTRFATMANAVASLTNEFRKGNITPDQHGAGLLAAIQSIPGVMAENSWMKDTADFFDMFSAGQPGQLARKRYIPNKVGSIVPAAVADYTQNGQIDGGVAPPFNAGTDNKVHDLTATDPGWKGIAQRSGKAMESRTPWLSQTLPQQHNAYGVPMTRDKNPFTGMNYQGNGDENFTHSEMARLAEATGAPLVETVPSKFKFAGKHVELEPEDHQHLIEAASAIRDDLVGKLIASPNYGNMTDALKAKAIKGMDRIANKRAEAAVMIARTPQASQTEWKPDAVDGVPTSTTWKPDAVDGVPVK